MKYIVWEWIFVPVIILFLLEETIVLSLNRFVNGPFIIETKGILWIKRIQKKWKIKWKKRKEKRQSSQSE